MAQLQYVGPFSPAAYQAAEMIASGGGGAPYSPEIIDAANQIISLNGGGNTSVLGASTTNSNVTPAKQLNQSAVDSTQQAIDSLGTELNTGYKNIDDSYGSLTGKYDREAAANEADFNEQSDTNTNNLLKNKQNALLAAAQGRRGLRGTLAAIGALNGDGSILADRAVTTAANQDIGEAGDTFATNAQVLDKSIKKFREEDKDRRAEAETTRTNQRTALEGNVASKKQDFFQKMAELYAGADRTGEADSYLKQAGDLNNEIASKTRIESTAFAPRSAAFTPGKLESYLAGAGDMTVDVAEGGNGGANNPTSILAGRTNRKKDEEKQMATV